MKKHLIFFVFCISQVLHAENLKDEPIKPIRALSSQVSEEKIRLGLDLFQEKKLSANNTVSCASCHNLFRGGVDNLNRSIGINGAVADVNSPTVFNSGLNFVQFWDGRAKTLEDQMDGPIQHPKEMGTTWADVVEKIKQDTKYKARFAAQYSDGVTVENIKDAIASFERALITPNAKFDKYLAGEAKVLTEKEILGYNRFKSLGCVACHQGQNVGGNMFQTMGIMGDYFKDRKNMPLKQQDLGRFNVTKREQDKYVFRVPSLRNVELTSPYFHDGYAKTLNEAVLIMGRYQLGQTLSKEDADAIVAFLKTLTGELPAVLKENSK
ncbi:MAG: cytochrome-c peroxidase [Bdellovibrionota bacterium]